LGISKVYTKTGSKNIGIRVNDFVAMNQFALLKKADPFSDKYGRKKISIFNFQ